MKKTEEGSYVAELREDVARAMLAPHIPVRSRGAQVLAPAGMVTINVADGVLKDYAVTVSARLKTDVEEREFEWLVRTVIKDVNGTKVDVPEEAKRKLTAERPD